jgi:Domain of unknown function (DUF4276)
MLVEGQSEEAFVKQTLAPWLAHRGVFVQGPTLLWTKRLPAGSGFRGGVSGWAQIVRNLQPLLNDSDAWVTTLLDFYGLPGDVPGWAEHRGNGPAADQAAAVQAAIAQALGPAPRFLPFLALHEFEAWVFADPAVVAQHFGSGAIAAALSAEVPEQGGPEDINHGAETHPMARLGKHCPGYKKSSDGPTILGKIGIETIRSRCPHFSGWLARLEALGAPAA